MQTHPPELSIKSIFVTRLLPDTCFGGLFYCNSISYKQG